MGNSLRNSTDSSTDDDVTEKLTENDKPYYRDRENMTDKVVQQWQVKKH